MEKKLLDKMQAIVSQCDRCGSCTNVCPLFLTQGRELAVARGKVSVLRALLAGGVDADSQLTKVVDYCLLCKACVANCPSKVKTDEAVMLSREYLARKLGVPLRYRLIGSVFQHNGLLGLVGTMIALGRKTGLFKLLPSGLTPEQYSQEQFLRMFAGPAALPMSTVTEKRLDPAAKTVLPAKKVAYFQGCAMKMFFPEASQATRDVLGKTTTIATPDNVCCGMPHSAHGMSAESRKLAKKNIALFSDADVVVTDCGSCGSSLKEYAALLANDEDWREAAAAFSRKVMDLTEYLVGVDYKPQYKSGFRVTYHDPCHLVRGQGIKKPPRDLLKMAGEYVELPQADMCCGGAGSFHVDFPEASGRVLAVKTANIERVGADIIVTGCPSCMIQLSKGSDGGKRYKVMHISQVL